MRPHSTIACLVVALTCVDAAAGQLRLRSSTILMGREEPRGEEAVLGVPLYELLALEVTDLELPGADQSRFVLQGWGRLQLADDPRADTEADLGLFFFDGRFGPMTLRLGRQHLASGVGRMQMIDGGDLVMRLPGGFSAEAFWGASVHPLFRMRTGDWQGGGRLAAHVPELGDVGIGYREQRMGGDVARREVGMDALVLFGATRWVALGVVDPEAERLIEARLAATLTVSRELSLTAEAERAAPDLLLPRTSIFWVFSDTDHDSAGGEADWRPSPYWRFYLDGAGLAQEGIYLGYRGSVGAITYREAAHRSLIGGELRRVDERLSGYSRLRLYTSLALLESLRFAGDLFLYALDEEVNGAASSYLGQASGIWDLAPGMRIAATLQAGVTAFAESEISALVRFVYGRDLEVDTEVAE